MAMKNINYDSLLKQIKSLTESEPNLIANLANISALIHEALKVLWTGFYFVEANTNELVLGPFQGPIACTRIPFGKGVCGTSWSEDRILNIPDVHQFSGHIACSSFSQSEIVIPLHKNGIVFCVLDIDSTELNFFDEADLQGLKSICSYIETII